MPLSDETAIRTQFEERARAHYNKDAKAAVRHYAEDIVNFNANWGQTSKGTMKATS